MRRHLVTAIMVLLLSSTVASAASTLFIDDGFVKTKQWLSQEKLSITGGSRDPKARDDKAAFLQNALLFYGEAVGDPASESAAQRAAMAKRGAVVTAQRAVAEYLRGFQLSGETEVSKMIVKKDSIVSAVDGFIEGLQVVFQEYNKDLDTAVAIVKIGLAGPDSFGAMLYEKMLSDPEIKAALDKPEYKPENKPEYKPQSTGLDNSYDGLIVDLSGQRQFRPSLMNRIFNANGEAIYNPSKISQKVLTETGCGEYTNSVEKAKAALAYRGVKNPLVVKASGLINPCDLRVSDEDALTIYSANRNSNFIAAAKVAFVLK